MIDLITQRTLLSHHGIRRMIPYDLHNSQLLKSRYFHFCIKNVICIIDNCGVQYVTTRGSKGDIC